MPDDFDEADAEFRRRMADFDLRFAGARRRLEDTRQRIEQTGQNVQGTWQVVERHGRVIRHRSSTTVLDEARRLLDSAADPLALLNSLPVPWLPVNPPTTPPADTDAPPAATTAAPHVGPSRSLWDRLEEEEAESVASSGAEVSTAVPRAPEPPPAVAAAPAPRRTVRRPNERDLVVIVALLSITVFALLVLH